MAHENAVAGTGVWNDKRIDRRKGAVADCPVGLAVFVRDGGMGWVRKKMNLFNAKLWKRK